MGVCDNREQAGGAADGQLERQAEAISWEFSSQAVASTLWEYANCGRNGGGSG